MENSDTEKRKYTHLIMIDKLVMHGQFFLYPGDFYFFFKFTENFPPPTTNSPLQHFYNKTPLGVNSGY